MLDGSPLPWGRQPGHATRVLGRGTRTYPDFCRHLPVAPGAGHDPVDVAGGDVRDEALAQQVSGAVGRGTGQDPGVLEACPHLDGEEGVKALSPTVLAAMP